MCVTKIESCTASAPGARGEWAAQRQRPGMNSLALGWVKLNGPLSCSTERRGLFSGPLKTQPQSWKLPLHLSSLFAPALVQSGALGFLTRLPQTLKGLGQSVPAGGCCLVSASLLSTPLSPQGRRGLVCGVESLQKGTGNWKSLMLCKFQMEPGKKKLVKIGALSFEPMWTPSAHIHCPDDSVASWIL